MFSFEILAKTDSKISFFFVLLFRIKQTSTNKVIEFSVTSGLIELPKNREPMFVTIVSQRLKSTISLKKRGITKLDIVHVIHYSSSIPTIQNQSKQKPTADTVETAAIEIMTNLLQKNQFNFNENSDITNSNQIQFNNAFRRQHTKVWNSLWETGFQISTSLAEDVINGDQINATIYAVLSHCRTYEFEIDITEQFRAEILKSLAYAEGCYDSYHTLQAGDLWKKMSSIDEMNKVVMSWLLTLEKQVRN